MKTSCYWIFHLPLLRKYYDINRKGGKVFPMMSNQRINSYLKEIADLCGIKKNLTFHMARHTFATTIALHSIALKYKSL